MPTIVTPEGTELHYKGWGNGRPVVLSHGWPLTADAWEDPMLFLASRGYGDDDQIVPMCASALLASKLIPHATLKIYAGGDHGICATQKDRVNADLLEFFGGPH